MLTYFLIDAAQGDDFITINSAFKSLLPQCKEWFKVGTDLSLDFQTLVQISVKHKDKADIALMEVVRQWYYNDSNPNWTKVNPLLSSKLIEGVCRFNIISCIYLVSIFRLLFLDKHHHIVINMTYTLKSSLNQFRFLPVSI